MSPSLPGSVHAALPRITQCAGCGTIARELICHICKEPRPAWLRLVAALRALKEAA